MLEIFPSEKVIPGRSYKIGIETTVGDPGTPCSLDWNCDRGKPIVSH